MNEQERLSLATKAADAFIRNNLGVIYSDARFVTCQITLTIKYIQMLEPGQLIVLHGPPGCGKTYSAACWMRRDIERNSYRKGYTQGIYITAAEVEEKFCQPGFWDSQTKSDWRDLLYASWVVLDDLGTESPMNQMFLTKFHRFFEERHRRRLTTIILTNIRIEEYGPRIVSRIRDWGVDGSVWQIKGEDLRKNQREVNSSRRKE